MAPSVGRIVHYVSYGTPGGEYAAQCRAAIVAAVGPYPEGISEADKPNIAVPLDLVVLNPTGLFFNQLCVQDELTKTGGTWHWPERVE